MRVTNELKEFLTRFLDNCGEHDAVAENLARTLAEGYGSDIETAYNWRDITGRLWKGCVAHGVRLGRFLLAWLDTTECGGGVVENATVVECADYEEAREFLADLIEQNTDNPEIGETYYFEAVWGRSNG